MKIAASTTTTRSLPVLEAVDAVAGLGYDGLEVWVEHLWDQGVPAERVRRAAEARGLALTMHGPQRDLNVTSSNAGIRVESQRQYLAALEDAAALGARVLVLHPGAMSSASDVPEAFWPVLDEFMARVGARAAALGLRVGVENMERRRLEFVTTPEAVIAMLRRVDCPALGLTLDVAHQFYNGGPLDLDTVLPAVVHVHVSGSTREQVHVPLAEGVFPIRPVLAELHRRFDGFAAVEGYVRGRDRKTLAANRATLAEWLGQTVPAPQDAGDPR